MVEKLDLNNLREELDKIDKTIAGQFEARMNVITKIAQYKIENNLPTYDASRESFIIERNKSYVSSKYQQYYGELFGTVLKVSKQYQDNLKEQHKKKEQQQELEK